MVLLLFVLTYRGETVFSAYIYTKTKFRTKLDAAPDLRILLPDIKLNLRAKVKL